MSLEVKNIEVKELKEVKVVSFQSIKNLVTTLTS